MKRQAPRRAERAAAASPARRRTLLALALAGCGLLPACGGGDASPAAAQGAPRMRPTRGVDSGGTGYSRVSAPVQHGQPLVAGDVQFSTVGASFVDADGAPFDPSSLAPGMSVDVDAGSVSDVDGQLQAPAHTVRRAEQLLGALQSPLPASGSFQVWGQTVLVTTDTVFDTSLAPDWSLVAPGTPVRVWGQLDTVRRRVVATRIDRPDAAAQGVVRGVVTQIDSRTGLVALGTLRVLPAPGVPAVLPADVTLGSVVRLTLQPGAGTSVAWLTVRADALKLGDDERVTIDGRISTLSSPSQFAVDGVPVDASQAEFEGKTPTPGARVKVTGAARDGQVLASSVVVAEDDVDEVVELEGSIQSVNNGAARFVVRRTTVGWDTSTRFEGGTAAALRPNRAVSVKGRRQPGSGVVQALYVHVEL